MFLHYSIVFIFFQHYTTLANKKERATGSLLLGLIIYYEIAQKGGENAPENAKMMVYKKRLIDHHTWLYSTK